MRYMFWIGLIAIGVLNDVIFRERDVYARPEMMQRKVYEVHNRITHVTHFQPFGVQRGLQELVSSY